MILSTLSSKRGSDELRSATVIFIPVKIMRGKLDRGTGLIDYVETFLDLGRIFV